MEFLSTCKIHDDIEGMCLNVIFKCETGAGSWREQLQSEGPAGGSGGKDAGEEVWPSTAHTGTGDTWRVSRNNMLFPPGMMVSLLPSMLVSVTSSFLTESELLTFLTCLPLLPQELVSIGTEGRAGDMSVLGNVKHKMVCSPDFEALLESCSWCSSERWRPEHPQVWQMDALVVGRDVYPYYGLSLEPDMLYKNDGVQTCCNDILKYTIYEI